MLNWFDLMRQAQENPGFDLLTRQFRLSDDQATKALAAFLPAFAMGMQHLMLTAPSNPFLQSLAGTASANPWQAMGQAFSPQAPQNGKLVIDSIFATDEASRRVAQQVADFTGLNIDLMRQILPLMAGLLAGTLHGMMTSQERMAEILSPPAKKPRKAASPEPWAELWTGWMQAFQPNGGEAGTRKPSPSSPKEDALPPWQGVMQQGHEMQMQYLASLQSILDEAWKPRGSGR